jgi:hypothetical protein
LKRSPPDRLPMESTMIEIGIDSFAAIIPDPRVLTPV